MPLTYCCPKCDSTLNPNVRVVLIAHYGDRKGLVLMSSQLGNYQVICDKGICHDVSKGDIINFACPVCHGSLTSKTHEKFAEVRIVSNENAGHKRCLLRFSRVSEEHATFLYDGDLTRHVGMDGTEELERARGAELDRGRRADAREDARVDEVGPVSADHPEIVGRRQALIGRLEASRWPGERRDVRRALTHRDGVRII